MPSLADPPRSRVPTLEHRAAALAAAQRVLHDRAAAEDVVQDVFAQLWRRPRGSMTGAARCARTSRCSRAAGRLTAGAARRCRDSLVDRLGPDAPTQESSASERVIERERRAEVVRSSTGSRRSSARRSCSPFGAGPDLRARSPRGRRAARHRQEPRPARTREAARGGMTRPAYARRRRAHRCR